MAKTKADPAADAAGGAKTTKADMVRAALADLGAKAKPQAIHDHIKSKFGAEIPKSIISNYKFNLNKKGGAAPARRGPGRPRAAAAATGDTVRIDDLEAVRTLVARIGGDQVVRLVKVLG